MKLTFLQAGVPLTKTFSKDKAGVISKSSYPSVYEVTTLVEDARDLRDMERLLIKHAALGHCLLKGNPTRDLVAESRAGTTDSNATTEWIVLDLDGIPNVASVDDFLKALRFDDVSYIVQWSASMNITSNDLRAHVYLLLAAPMSAPLIKQWLISLNHSIQLLRDAMKLTKTGNSISWPLDISACQNDKLLYIAPPILKGLKDPFAKKPRIEYVRKTHNTLVVASTIASTAQNRELTAKRINELRTAEGLPTRKTTYKMHGGTEVMVKPDSCIVTDMKTDRGFVYFNLNGGDSWGYFHPEDNPDYIHNFKGEPAYVTKELLPEYWQTLTQQAVRVSSLGVTYLAFCDPKTGSYWRGTHDAQTDTLNLNIAKNETQIRHFAKQQGMPLGDFIPEWDLTFDPHDNVRVDTQNKSVNTFEPTIYMKAVPKKVKTCPPLILRIIHHALGSDVDVTEHFMNWLAYILQYRDRAKTAWVMHGTTGTGKGVLMNKIIRPLFGANQTAARRMEDLNEQYNGYMQKCFIVFIDEVESKALINERGVMAKLKNFITEEFITIRDMYQAAHEVRSYMSMIFASNKTDPVTIDKEDRRFNVGRYQKSKLVITDKELDETIPKELQGFHDYLMGYAVDTLAASTPLETDDRNQMISVGESSIDTVSSALLGGSMEFFLDQLPTTTAYERNAVESNKVADYLDVIKCLLARTDLVTGSCNISREELRTIFDYTIGGIPASPNKFTSLLKHHRIHISKVWIDKSIAGIKTTWLDVAQFPAYIESFKPVQPKTKAKP